VATATQARDGWLADFDRLSAGLPAANGPWLGELRRHGIDRFADLGFPGPKNEDWKYTSVGGLLKVPHHPSVDLAPKAALAAARAAVEQVAAIDDGPVLAFVGGRFVADLSRLAGADAKGVRVASLRSLLAEDPELLAEHLGKYAHVDAHAFAALNTAFLTDGAAIFVAPGCGSNAPIHLVFVSPAASDPSATHPRNLIVGSAGASLCVVEHYVGEDGASNLTNAVTEIALGRDATCAHYKVQREAADAYHVHRIEVRQETGSSFTSHSLAFGAGWSRTEIATILGGERAECALYGLYLGSGDQHVDHHTTIDHAVARTRSRELYKGVLDERARGVFTGKVLVRRDAQQISAEQSNKNLLLSDGAVVETRPQLEIYADDVRCSHGAAIGRLDDNMLFYLRQRGIGLADARALLTYGFGSEVIETMPAGVLLPLREHLAAEIGRRLGRKADGAAGAVEEGGQGR